MRRLAPVTLAARIVAIALAAGAAEHKEPANPAEFADKVVSLSDGETIRVEFNPESGRFVIVDLRAHQRWPQTFQGAAQSDLTAVERSADGRGLHARLKTAAGQVEMTIAIERPAEVVVTLRPDGAGKPLDIGYPWPLLAPSEKAELVLPTDEGAIFPATCVDSPRLLGTYNYHQFGFLMPWFGFIEGERGLMALAETPDDLSIRIGKSPAGGKAKPLLTAGVVWLPSRNGLRYERRVRFCVFDRGGYVAMAKRYRKFLVDAGRFRTLAEKAKELPSVNKLIGAVDIYDQSPGGCALDWMISNGIRHAMYSGPRDKANNEKAQAAGYVTSRYNNYASIATPELLAVRKAKPDPNHHFMCADVDDAFIRRDGSPQPGFANPIGAKGGVLAVDQVKTVHDVYRCSTTKLAWIRKGVPVETAEQALIARFLDVETASPPTECFSEKHPLTRTEDIRTRTKLFDYLRSVGQIAGSEGGADWPAHALHYQEGSLTLNHLNYLKGIYFGTAPFDLTDDYIVAQFNMARRVPLHKLVYHDSVLMTWRWNHTPNRWAKGAECWDDWDLLHILYGGMPIFVVDKQNIEQKGERILKSCRDICGVLEKIGGCEMLSHRFLSPDRQAQETRFANGWAVAVNFHQTQARTTSSGERIGPKSFTTYRWRD